MYANAVFKPRVPESTNLAEFIKNDLVGFRNDHPGLRIERASPLRTADGKSAESHWLRPDGVNAQWERVSYVEEGEFYLVFVLSSRTQAGLSGANPAYEEFVRSYRE